MVGGLILLMQKYKVKVYQSFCVNVESVWRFTGRVGKYIVGL